MNNLKYLDNFFFENYFNRNGFWYAFKRSVNDIDNLQLLLRYLQVYHNRNWFKNQKEYSDILIKEKILIPTRSTEDSSANSRGIKKVFEFLGFCYVDEDEKLQITSAGRKFLEKNTNDELYEIKTNQLLKYQINNPLIKANSYKDLKIKPYTFLLELLLNLENQSIDMTEYKLFVCRAHNYKELDLIINRIREWRSLDEQKKNLIFKRISSNNIFKTINAYSSYSLSFFGKSTFTEISEIEDEKVLFLKQNKSKEVENILNIKDIHHYKTHLDKQKKFIEFYGGYEEKEKNNLNKIFRKNFIKKEFKNLYDKKESSKSYKKLYKEIKVKDFSNIQNEYERNEKERIILNEKIENLFFLSGRTLNVLKNEQILYLKDLLFWEIENLTKMQGMGSRSVEELISQLKEFNKKNKTNFNFFQIKDQNPKPINENRNIFKRLNEIEWSIRTSNVFKDQRMVFVGDLVHVTEKELLRYPKFGKQSLNEIKNVLKSMKLELGQTSTWPPDDLESKAEALKISNDKKFDQLSDDDQINFFRPIKSSFDNIRVINACLNSNITNLGDLHQNISKLDELNNLGTRSIEEIKIMMRKFISLPIGINILDWDKTKLSQYIKYEKKLSKYDEIDNEQEFGKFDYLDDEIIQLMKKINFKRQDIIDFHYGLDGTGLKTLQTTGDKFNVTRERIRQITLQYLILIKKRNIKGLINLKKIEDILNKITPISCFNFEKYLIEKKYVKKRFLTPTILSLLKLFLQSKKFILLNQKKIIDQKDDLKYPKFKDFFRGSNVNKFGLIDINLISKKFNLSISQISDLLNFQEDISILDNKWIYDTDKIKNRLFNILQKIFNINSKINKFEIIKAIKRMRRIETPSIEGVIAYCKKELNANYDGTEITIPEENISNRFFNSSIKIHSDIETSMISCFKNDKILTYRQLVSKLIDKGENENSSNQYVSGNTPVIIKVFPGCYSLVGTKLNPGEAEEFYQANKDKGNKIITEYDYNEDGSIWVGYEINQQTKDKRNFRISNSIFDVLKGNYIVKGKNHQIKINKQKYISRLGNNLIEDKLKNGDDIIFTFNLNNRYVEIEIGQNLMKEKYNQ